MSWFSECRGGEFVFYPEGAGGAPVTLAAKRNTAVVLDTDSVFHGVDPVAASGRWHRSGRACTSPSTARGGGASARAARRSARYRWTSCASRCRGRRTAFGDDAERHAWREHTDDLELGFILGRLVENLRARGRVGRERPDDTTLALTMIDEYVRFPASTAA